MRIEEEGGKEEGALSPQPPNFVPIIVAAVVALAATALGAPVASLVFAFALLFARFHMFHWISILILLFGVGAAIARVAIKI